MGKGIGGHTKPNSGLSDSWITPKFIVDALGPFDLDPCASSPQPWACASKSIALPEDGLAADWKGRVWLNPPYSNVWEWLNKLARHNNGIALVFARTETVGFFREVWEKADGLLFLRGRLFFHLPGGERGKSNSGGPSVLVAYGEVNKQVLKNCTLAGAYIGLK